MNRKVESALIALGMPVKPDVALAKTTGKAPWLALEGFQQLFVRCELEVLGKVMSIGLKRCNPLFVAFVCEIGARDDDLEW